MSMINNVTILLKESHRRGQLECYRSSTNADVSICFKNYFNGRLQFRFTLKEGKLHGVGRMWYSSGDLHREDPFYKGILHGRQRIWYENGGLKEQRHFTNNALHGQQQQWYPNARSKSEYYYIMNKLDGLSTEWYENGHIKEQVTYQDGKRHGINKEYSSKGRLIRKQLYLRDVRLTGRIQRLLSANRLKAQHILKIGNAALRRICLEELGYERFLAGVDHKFLDEHEDRQLLRIDWHEQEEPLYLVKVRCPSTSAYYTLRVPPEMKTVQQAVAWTFGLTEHEYQPKEES